MALDPNLSNIISQLLTPHLNEMHKSNLTFRQVSEGHNDKVKQIVNQIFNAINYNNSNINSLLSSVESSNQQTQQIATEIRSLSSAISANNYSLNRLLNEFNNFSKVSKQSMNRQTSLFSNFSESFSIYSKRLIVSMGFLGKRLTGGAAIGSGAIATGAAATVLGGIGAAGVATALGSAQMKAIESAKASQAEAAEAPSPAGSTQRERETAQSDAKPLPSAQPETSSLSGDLAADRKARFSKELENNPELMNRLYNLARTEVGGIPKDQQKFIETVFNRAMFSNKSISAIVSSVGRGKYYPGIKNFKPTREQLDSFNNSVVGGVMRGSDLTDLATDNASNAPGNPVANRRLRAGVRGKWLGEGKQKELYYSGSEGKYKTAHGVEAKKYREKIERKQQQQQQQGQQQGQQTPSTPQTPSQPDASRGTTEQSTQPDATPKPKFDKSRFIGQNVYQGAYQLNPDTQAALSRFLELNPDAKISSAYRDPGHERERRKRVPGAHTRGAAVDVSVRDKSKEELENIIKHLKKSGFNTILLEGDPPHIHAQIKPGAGFTIQNYKGGLPGLSLEEARRAAVQVEREPPGAAKPKDGSVMPRGLMTPENRQKLEQQKPEAEPQAKPEQPKPQTGLELNKEAAKKEAERQNQQQQSNTQPQQPGSRPSEPSNQTVATASSWGPRNGSHDYSNLAAYYGQKNVHDSYISKGSQIV